MQAMPAGVLQAMPAIPFFSQPPNPPCLRRASTYPRPPPFPGRAPTEFGPQPSRIQVFLVSPTHQRVGDALLRLAPCPLRKVLAAMPSRQSGAIKVIRINATLLKKFPLMVFAGPTPRQPKKSHDSPEGRKLVNHTKTLTEGGLRPVVSWSLS